MDYYTEVKYHRRTSLSSVQIVSASYYMREMAGVEMKSLINIYLNILMAISTKGSNPHQEKL